MTHLLPRKQRTQPGSVIRATLVVCWFLHLFRCAPVAAQPKPAHGRSPAASRCRDDILEADNYLIRTVKVKARYLPIAFQLPEPGTPYSPVLVTKLVEDVQDALKRERNRENVEGTTELGLLKTISVGKPQMEERDSSGAVIGFSGIFSCAREVEPAVCQTALGAGKQKCVDLTIETISVRLDTASPWGSLLNAARSNQPTAFSQVPGWLRAFNPAPGLDYDRRFGITETLALSTNLLDLRKNLKREPLAVGKTRMELAAQGRKSQNEPFYEGQSQLTLGRRMSAAVERVGLEAGFSANHQPHGSGDYLQNAATIGGNLKFKPQAGPIGGLTLGAAYQRSSNRFSKGDGTPGEFISTRALQARLISDGQLWSGFTRFALWAEVASPEQNGETYRRLAGMLGYAKEFPVAPNQTVGVEAIFGGGRIWDEAPQYARFFGGNSTRNFLYESSDSALLTTLPAGPLLRSFGRNQATAGTNVGGTSYLHFNLNVSLPIPRWSSPLIPDITLDNIPKKDASGKFVKDEDGLPIFESRPLKAVIKSQGETSRRSLRRILMKEEKLSELEAQAKADRELKGVNSILAFISDRANLYSVKPLIMFDAAQLDAPGRPGGHTRYAAGAGLQLTVVIAQFEIGYLHTLRRLPGDDRGNLVMRLVFRNLF